MRFFRWPHEPLKTRRYYHPPQLVIPQRLTNRPVYLDVGRAWEELTSIPAQYLCIIGEPGSTALVTAY